MNTPTLHNLKERATISELALIEVIEAAVRADVETLPPSVDQCFQAALDALAPLANSMTEEFVRDLPMSARENIRVRVKGHVDRARREYCRKLGVDVPAL